ncbi:ZIP family metal transporter [Mycoplasma struthionis]|uniref:ZIP Zinc transporter n=1 Tax=Mycoplasma struthionis TaxID=538220 RepID=A0A3G8LHT1_9MOLU|nr:hypothetical protein [Mycoplasma struthionis]AZG68785.1 hypothetical protein EGN60_02345 [Mycoplasma struthionis]
MFVSESENLTFYPALAINVLIYICILLGGPLILLFILSLFKFKITKKSNIYLYAFSTGMFLMIGAVGFLQESYRISSYFLHQIRVAEKEIPGWTALIIGLGAFIGLSIVIIGRYIFVKSKKNHFHANHEEHSHSDHLISFKDIDNPKAGWLAIIMIMSHRIIDGLFLGYSVYSLLTSYTDYTVSIPLIITFNIHILLEVVIIYYRQLQYGEKKWKAILYNFLTFLLIIPFLLIGAFTGKLIDKFGFVLPSLMAAGGAIIVFMAVFELIPEFIHVINQNAKVLYSTFALFAFAILFTIVLLSFHSHGF